MALARGILIWLPLDHFLTLTPGRSDELELYRLRAERIFEQPNLRPASAAQLAAQAVSLGELTVKHVPPAMSGHMRCRAIQLRNPVVYQTLIQPTGGFDFDFTLALESGDPELFRIAWLGHGQTYHFAFRDPLDILRHPNASTYYQKWLAEQREGTLQGLLRQDPCSVTVRNKVAVFGLFRCGFPKKLKTPDSLTRLYLEYYLTTLWREGQRKWPAEVPDNLIGRTGFYYHFGPEMALSTALMYLYSERAEQLLRDKTEIDSGYIPAWVFHPAGALVTADLAQRCRQMLAVLARFEGRHLLQYRTSLRIVAGLPLEQESWPDDFEEEFLSAGLGDLALVVAHPELEDWMIRTDREPSLTSTVHHNLRRHAELVLETRRISYMPSVIFYAQTGRLLYV